MGAIQVQAKSFTSTTSGKFVIQTMETSETLTTSGNTDDALASVSLDSNIYKVMGKKFPVTLEIVSGFADVAANFGIQYSLDGTNWTATKDTLDTDTTPNVTGTYTYLADLTDMDVPFFRFVFNDSYLTVGGSGTLKFGFAYSR
jgi:hypothetical protein